MKQKKKLIEVAIPLQDINKESAREKSIRHGHPSTLHLWWARRPLAACRAVLFAQLVDDPSSHPEKFPTEKEQVKERERLFNIIRELLPWENMTDPSARKRILKKAYKEIEASCDGEVPPIYDPFSGGGSIPLEAQRLGLKAYGSDLNPVAVMIGKALVEIPPKFNGLKPVNSEFQQMTMARKTFKGAEGLAEDVKFYGEWMREKAFEKIGKYYPEVELPNGGGKATVIAWLWTRTIKCENPTCSRITPLLSTLTLSSKKGKESYLDVALNRNGTLEFEVSDSPTQRIKDSKKGLKRGVSGIFECIHCGNVSKRDYVAEQGCNGKMNCLPTAIVYEGDKGRGYIKPQQMEVLEHLPIVSTKGLEIEFEPNPRDIWCRNFGLTEPYKLFTKRQLLALTTFSDLVHEARELVLKDAIAAGMADDQISLEEGGKGATAYADAVAVYLAFAVDKASDYWSSICSWNIARDGIRSTFARHALPMVWDFAEVNPFSSSSGNFLSGLTWIYKFLLSHSPVTTGEIQQLEAQKVTTPKEVVFSSDPPYYDNIGYADLSDFFYVWLRKSLRKYYPKLFSTLMVPKAPELVATPYRHGSKAEAEEFFVSGMRDVFKTLNTHQDVDFPVTIYYAFKQEEIKQEGLISTGWATFLQAIVDGNWAIVGTWPVRTERSGRMIEVGNNALASSIVLVCRKRTDEVNSEITRREFLRELKRELPSALQTLQESQIAPVDMAQSAIGPGIAVFTRYNKVIESDGSAMSVATALRLINDAIDEFYTEQEGRLDPATRFALTWFEQHGFNEAAYGEAETLANARNIAVNSMERIGILSAKSGKVRLLKRNELGVFKPSDRAYRDNRCIWLETQNMMKVLQSDSFDGAGKLLQELSPNEENIRDLAYRLYSICDKKKRSDEALNCNQLIQDWEDVLRVARESKPTQTSLSSHFSNKS